MHPQIVIAPALTALLALTGPQAGTVIEGRVTGPDGKPRTATVRVLQNPDDRGSIPGVVRTGEDGRFEVDMTAAGQPWVRIESFGLQPVVLKGDIASPLNVRLAYGTSVQGRVVDSRSGEGLSDATVWICDADATRFGLDACPAHAAGAGGLFALTGVPATAVRLGASSPAHAFASTRLPAHRSGKAFHLIELEAGAPLSGRVVDDGGRPVAGARIGRDEYAVPFSDATEIVFDPPLITDENGTFRHPGVEARSRWVYRGLVDGWYGVPSGWVSPVKGTGRSVELKLERPATLQFGLALANGDPVQPKVRLLHYAMGTVRGPSSGAETDGRYRLDGLPTKPLELKLTIEGYQPLDLGEVPLGPGKTVDLGDLGVMPGIAFNGTVVDDDGNHVVGSWVELAYSEPIKYSYRRTTNDGTFRFEGLPTDVELRLTSGAEGFDTVNEKFKLRRNAEREITLTPLASIRGRVLEPGGEPVTQFAVRAINEDTEVRVLAKEDVNDPDGRFFLWPIEPLGRHTLEIVADGFAVRRVPDLVVEEFRSVEVGDVHLESGHLLEGFAARPDGSPAEGGRVWLVPRSRMMDGNPAADERSYTAWADRDGRYTITGMSPGFFVVNAQHPEYSPWSSEVELVEGVPLLTLDIEFTQGGVVHGYATDRTAAPVADVRVTVDCPGLAAERSASTDSQGYYRLGRLPDAQCRVGAFVEAGKPYGNSKLVTIVGNRESRVDFDLSKSIEVTGIVRVGGRIADRGFLSFQASGSFSGAGVASATVERGTGRYRAEVSEPGEYDVRVQSGGARQVVKIRIGDGPSVQRDFNIPINSIRGRVLDTDGKPMPGVAVAGSNTDLDLVATMGLSTTSNQQGGFELRNLEPGSYTVVANKRGYRTARSAQVHVQSDTRIDNIELILDTSSAQLRGRLIDPRGVPLTEGFVVAAPAGFYRLELSAQTSVQRDGTFVLDVPADGALDVTALSPGWAAARASGIVPSDDTEITLQAGFGGRVVVTVVDRDGAPREGVMLEIRAEPEWLASNTLWMFNAPAVSGPDGTAVAQRIPEGTYRVSVPGGASGTVSVVENGTTELRLQSD